MMTEDMEEIVARTPTTAEDIIFYTFKLPFLEGTTHTV